MQQLVAYLCLILITIALPAAEPEFGTVQRVDGTQLHITLQNNVEIPTGSILTIYGPGSVRKHPLTQTVLVEQRQAVAKAKVVANQPTMRAVIIWQKAAVSPGFDAVYEAGPRPNGVPQLADQPTRFLRRSFNGEEVPIAGNAIPAQSTVRINLPISDPDNDSLTFSWSVGGNHPGYLHQTFSKKPEVLWTAPAQADMQITLTVRATDSWGQQVTFSEKLRTIEPVTNWNRRQTIIGGIREDAKPSQAMAIRLTGNRHLSLSLDGKVFIHQGWFSQTAFPFEKTPRSVKQIAPTMDGGFMALSRYSNKVHRFDQDGKELVRYEGLYEPSDMVELADGTVAISDPERKGIELFSRNGTYLARLGRDFEISRLTTNAKGDLLALDGNTIRRFDRWWRPLSSWQFPTPPETSAVDIAHFYDDKGTGAVFVALSNGVILHFNESGKALGTYEEALTHPLLKDGGKASSLHVDLNGLITVFFPETGHIARLKQDGSFHSCRFDLPNYGTYAYGNGTLWIADNYKKNIYQVDNQGWVIGGMKSPDGLKSISEIAASPDGTLLGILDKSNKQIHLMSTTNEDLSAISFGQSGRERGQFRSPVSISMDRLGRSYVVDAGLDKISVFDPNGQLVLEQQLGGKGPQHLASPEHIAVSPDGEYCIIYDDDDYLIKQYTIDHANKTIEHLGNLGGRGYDPGQVRAVAGLAVDHLGLVYVADSNRDDVQIWDVRGGNAVTIDLLTGDKLRLKEVRGMSVSGDGVFVVWNSGNLVLHHW